MKSIVLIVVVTMNNGDVHRSPAFHVNTEAECALRAGKIVEAYRKDGDIKRIGASCHYVIPEVDEKE